jgi:hypothetical protein
MDRTDWVRLKDQRARSGMIIRIVLDDHTGTDAICEIRGEYTMLFKALKAMVGDAPVITSDQRLNHVEGFTHSAACRRVPAFTLARRANRSFRNCPV